MNPGLSLLFSFTKAVRYKACGRYIGVKNLDTLHVSLVILPDRISYNYPKDNVPKHAYSLNLKTV